MAQAPRFIQKPTTDRDGLKQGASLPHNLEPKDVLRLVEDLHDLLHDLNTMLVAKGYDRTEELLDPAGFSGFISRSVVDRIARLSRGLVKNTHHNGYPDLLRHGDYSGDAVQHGTKGGLEVKASRFKSAWQAHGPRAGWFMVVQFALDEDESKALRDREPTKVLTVLIAELAEDDWSWQPAGEGRIRSGTASVKASGVVKLRSGAAWVDPTYQDEHDERLASARREVWREHAADDCLTALRQAGRPLKLQEVVAAVAPRAGVSEDKLRSTAGSALARLVKAGKATKPKRGYFAAN
jgi:hypothetical protein